MKSRFFTGFAIAAVVVALCGCRNYHKPVDTTQTDYEKDLKKELRTAEPLEKNNSEGLFKYKFKVYTETRIKTFEVHSTIARFTPYNWWRELYEVPMGCVVFPVGLCSHFLNVFSFGIFPYDWCWYMDCVGLSALNPFMNIESESRYDEEPLKVRRDMVDDRLEVVEKISDRQTAYIMSGKEKAFFQANKNGVAEILLLDDQGNGPTLVSLDRQLKLFAGSSATVLDNWIISRDLQKRLGKGSQIIKAYRANPTGSNLRKCVDELDSLGFITLSYNLERNELHRHIDDPNFKKEYLGK